MYHAILVPLDGSDLSERALPFAMALARVARARLILERVILPGESAAILPAVDFSGRMPTVGLPVLRSDEASPQARREAEDYLVSRLTVAADEPPVENVILSGDAASRIVDEARSRSVDLIVMSSHGRSGLGELVYGSVAGAVIHGVSAPVLVIPRGCTHDWSQGQTRRILVPLDGSETSVEALEPALSFANALDAEIILLRLVSPVKYINVEGYPDPVSVPIEGVSAGEAEGYLNGIAADLRKIAPRIRVLVAEAGDPAEGILAAAREQEVSGIAMATHGRGALARLVMGSVATGVARQAEVPILFVRPSTLH